ncbi:MAG: hypothetical protein WCF66_08995, partial [Pseudolabrys sp.]
CGRAAGRCGATDDGAFQEIATIKFLFCHRLPSLPEEAQKRGPRGHAFDAKHAAFESVRQDEVWPLIALHRIGR